MATTSPDIFPANGLRKLTPREAMQRARALNCTVPSNTKPSCVAQLNVGIFFDGTGNNMKVDHDDLPPEKRKHSNIVRLFMAYPEKRKKGYFAHYIPGVGTPFPEIGDSGKGLGGMGAWNGENRITWAFTQLLNAPHFHVLGSLLLPDSQAAQIANTLASVSSPGAQRKLALRTWQDKLKAALAGKKPKIELINLSVFGFSRGAAQARAFCNWLFEVCDQEDGGWTFAGIPIRLQFLGIFDTVASVGITDIYANGIMEGHQSWADGNTMAIHPAVEQCVHFVAGHEVRACFPLDSVRVGSSYPPNAKEVMYPGAHSNVGGGYAPNALGISPQANSFMCVITAARMYQEARQAGVPLIPWDQLGTRLQKEFTPSAETIADFNAYLAEAKVGAGPVEEMHKRHMRLYLSYRYKHRNALNQLPFYQRAVAKDRRYLQITTDTFHRRLRNKFSAYPVPTTDEKYDLVAARNLQEQMAKAAGLMEQHRNDKDLQQLHELIEHIEPGQLGPAMEKFFGNHLHDSMAGFIDMGGHLTNEYLYNGQGIMKFRKIFKGKD